MLVNEIMNKDVLILKNKERQRSVTVVIAYILYEGIGCHSSFKNKSCLN